MANKIILYTAPGCVYCQMVKDFFRQNNIFYEEKDISADEKAREGMVEKSGQLGVPVIDIDGKIVVGFDQEQLSQLLGIK
jgi:glutaredoxin-like YruB-family protein